MKVLFHYDAGPKLRERLLRLDDDGISVVCCPEGPDQPFFSELEEAEVLWHVLHPVTRQVIESAPRLRLIQKIGVGVNTIDLDAAKERGIVVCNMPGTNSRAVMELTLLHILAALRRYVSLDRLCRSGTWYPNSLLKESLTELGGKTVGLVGFGAVPQLLAPVLAAMDARVLYTDIESKPDVPFEFVDARDLFAQADVVCLHVPLTDGTRNLVDATRIESMKPGAILVNTARGGLVDQDALIGALRTGRLAAAGLDVFAQEPASESPLFDLENVSVTPHVAWLTNETLERSIEVARHNSLAAIHAGEFRFRVA